MAATKTEKSPGLFGIYLVALIAVWFGGLLGFVYLTTFPMQAFANMNEYEAATEDADAPEISKPGDGFYIEGPVLASRSWEAKRRLLNETGSQTVSLSSGEMNAWMESRFSAAQPAADANASNLLVVPGIPNFAIVENQGVYINLPMKLFVFGRPHEVVLTALGTVTSDGFEPRTVSLNSATIPLPKVLGSKVLDSLLQAFQSTEDYKILVEAFDRAESVSMESQALVFRLR